MKNIASGRPSAMIPAVPESVVCRFPHLRDQLIRQAFEDQEFLNLCNDYNSIIATLAGVLTGDSKERGELVGLKNSLEVEILERLTRSRLSGGEIEH